MYSNSAGSRVKLSRVKEDEILAEFDEFLAESVSACHSVHERAVKAHKHYTAFMQKQANSIYITDSYEAQFFGSMTAAVASEYAVINSSPYLLSYEPRSSEGDALSDFYDAAFDFHWKEDPRRNRKLQSCLLQRRLYGSVYGKFHWNEEWAKEAFFKEVESVVEVPIINPYDGLPSAVSQPVKERKWVTERRKKKDSPMFEVFNFFSCLPDTKQEYIQDGRFFIHRCRRTSNYLKEMALKGCWYKPVVRELLERGGATNDMSALPVEYIESLNAMVGFSQDDPGYSSSGLYEEFEVWTPEGCATIVDRRVVSYCRGHLLGRYPLFQVRNYLVPGEHFGMSDYQVVEKNISDYQNMHNTMLSNAYTNAFPPIAVASSIELKEFRQAWRPGGILRLPGSDVNASMRQLPTNTDSIETAMRTKQALAAGIDNVLASSETTRGSLPSRSTSATAVMQASQSLSVRQEMQSSMFEAEFIQELGEAFRDLVTKLQTDEVSLRIRGGSEWVKWRPLLGAYDPDLDCVPIAGSSKLSELEQKRLIELLNLAANFRIPNINLQEGFSVVVESMAPRLKSRLLMGDAEYQKMVQSQAMMQRLTEAPGPGNGTPGAMAVSNQIGNSAQDLGTDEMSQEYGEMNT